MSHPTSGSPTVRVQWTRLTFVLEEGDDPSENLKFSFDPAPSVVYNRPPAFGEASYALTLAEDAAVAAAVGSVSAADPNDGDTVTFSITAGNAGDVFGINAASGAITVAAALDFETTSTYSLTVQASDSESAAATVTVTITVTDVAEPPVFGAASYAFSVAEDAAEDAAVGTVGATVRANGAVTYAITAGNDAGAFAIDAGSGAITVDGALDYETTTSYTLTVTASHGVSTSTIAVAITVTDIVDTRPAKPTNLTATVNPAGSIDLSWDDPGDDSITGYQILRRRPTEGEETLLVYVENTGSSSTTYSDTNVTDGVRHVYRIKAINAIGLSEVSDFVRVEP